VDAEEQLRSSSSPPAVLAKVGPRKRAADADALVQNTSRTTRGPPLRLRQNEKQVEKRSSVVSGGYEESHQVHHRNRILNPPVGVSAARAEFHLSEENEVAGPSLQQFEFALVSVLKVKLKFRNVFASTYYPRNVYS